ncbi:MAG: tetratricopeptide repeat protein, partial [Candidatus Nealsonbacteria bacterium]|nr:tetratricopeptide repeat protein [Candidatus Nealsonbacteria bacterium]
MKGERRHELQHNELADYITGIVSTVKPYFNAILGSVLLVLVAALSYFWWSGRSVEQEQAGWNEFLVQRGKADFQLFDLDEFGERHKDTEVSFRVHAFSGDMQLIQGCQNLFVNKAAARDELGQAKEHYTAVRDECDDPVLLLRATFGLARVHEALGAVDQAVERYEEVVQNKEWSGTACASQAKKRLESLAQADNKWFYDQFAEYDPTPKTNPIDPGMLPFDPSSLGEPSGSGDGSGGSSLLDLPLLDGGTSQPDDTSLLPTFGGTGTTEPDGTPDAGTPDAGTPDAGTPDA